MLFQQFELDDVVSTFDIQLLLEHIPSSVATTTVNYEPVL